MKFDNESRQWSSLSEPILLDRLIGYRGFKALGFVGGSADRLFAVDTDLARPYWTTHLTYAAATLYALDARTGRELWSSGDQIATFNHFTSLSVANGRVYIGTFDGYLYCFGLEAAGGTK